MTVGYCWFHNRYLDADELKVKRCRCKENTKKRCKHLELISTKQPYRNESKAKRRA